MKQAKSTILIAIILMDFLAGTEFDLFVPSFPTLQKQFSISPFLLEVSIALVTIFNSTHALLITFAFLPFIISQIIPSNMLVPICLNFIPQAKAKVSAVLQGSRLVIAAFSLELAGHFYQGSFQNIGIIISLFIIMIIITQYFVTKNKEIVGTITADAIPPHGSHI